jgi:hypothetical protein
MMGAVIGIHGSLALSAGVLLLFIAALMTRR